MRLAQMMKAGCWDNEPRRRSPVSQKRVTLFIVPMLGNVLRQK